MRYVETDKYMDRQFSLERYNCWDFVREVWLDVCGEDLDRMWDWSPAGVEQAQGRFVECEQGLHPRLVLFKGVSSMPHVGVSFAEKVLHLRPAGVRFESLEMARIGFHTVIFYRTR